MMKFGSKLDEKNVRLFICYQLLSVFSFAHSRHLFHGNLRPSSISVVKDLWIHVSGFHVSDAFKVQDSKGEETKEKDVEGKRKEKPSGETNEDEEDNGESENIKDDESEEQDDLSLSEILSPGTRLRSPSIVERWVKGKMSNFDYLMAINELAGR